LNDAQKLNFEAHLLKLKDWTIHSHSECTQNRSKTQALINCYIL